MDLATLLRRGELPSEAKAPTPALAGIPTTIPEEAVGIKRIANLLVAGAIKILEIILPIYGVESEEGRRLKRAISNLSPLSKGITTDDLLGFLKMLGDLLPKTPSAFAGPIGTGILGEGTAGETELAPTAGTTTGTETERAPVGRVELEEILKRKPTT